LQIDDSISTIQDDKISFKNEVIVDCNYRYDAQNDFHDIVGIATEGGISAHNRNSLGLIQLPEKANIDESAKSMAQEIVRQWIQLVRINQAIPTSIKDLFTQDKKICGIINRGEHWFNVEIHFDKTKDGVQINFANPSGGYESSIPEDIKKWATNIVSLLEKTISGDDFKSILIVSDEFNKIALAPINDYVNSLKVDNNKSKINIQEVKLFEQASSQGCGPTAKANQILMLKGEFDIGEHKIKREQMPNDGLILTLQDEIQLRLQDSVEKYNKDDNQAQKERDWKSGDFGVTGTIDNIRSLTTKQYKPISQAIINQPKPDDVSTEPAKLRLKTLLNWELKNRNIADKEQYPMYNGKQLGDNFTISTSNGCLIFHSLDEDQAVLDDIKLLLGKEVKFYQYSKDEIVKDFTTNARLSKEDSAKLRYMLGQKKDSPIIEHKPIINPKIQEEQLLRQGQYQLSEILKRINIRKIQSEQIDIKTFIQNKNINTLKQDVINQGEILERLIALRTTVIKEIDKQAKTIFTKTGNKNIDIKRKNDVIRCTKDGAYLIDNPEIGKPLQNTDKFGNFTFQNGDSVKSYQDISSIIQAELDRLNKPIVVEDKPVTDPNIALLKQQQDKIKKILQDIYVEQEKSQSTLEVEFQNLIKNKDIFALQQEVVNKTAELDTLKQDKDNVLALKEGQNRKAQLIQDINQQPAELYKKAGNSNVELPWNDKSVLLVKNGSIVLQKKNDKAETKFETIDFVSLDKDINAYEGALKSITDKFAAELNKPIIQLPSKPLSLLNEKNSQLHQYTTTPDPMLNTYNLQSTKLYQVNGDVQSAIRIQSKKTWQHREILNEMSTILAGAIQETKKP
jgi:hypothetical protein